MRSWKIFQLGEPADQLRLAEDDETPYPTADQVVVDIAAVGLSFPDVLRCRGDYQVKPTLPFTPGGESAGTISAVGSDIDDLEVGQRVMVLGGGLREQAAVGAGSVFPIPDNLSFEGACALPVNYGTTWFALHERARIQPGETLLVTGAAGGTGSAAIQLGKAAGARVIAVAGGANKVLHAKSMGADVVIDHTRYETWVDAVREASDGGVDVAYDPVGGDVFHQVRRCMGWDGRLLVIGFVGGIPEMATNHILLKNYSVVGVHWAASLGRNPESMHEQMSQVLALAAVGAVDPLLYPAYTFEQASEGLQDLADRKTFGKVVVTV